MAQNPRQILEATESFVWIMDGEQLIVHAGTTRVAAGHVLATSHPSRFRDIQEGLSYPDNEEATANPGQQRARPQKAAAGAQASTEEE